MIVNIFSDTHLNVSRQAHTTAESSKRLNERLFEQAMTCKTEEMNVIVGDLFDKTFNPEWAVIQGIHVSSGNTTVLAGNHDETNREGTKCSLEVVAESGGDVVRNPKLSEVFVVRRNQLYFVPHHSTQELFDLALDKIVESSGDGENKYLFLHCNRGTAIGDKSDSTLYVSDEMEDRLLEKFTRIFYGHEHQPQLLKGGRVVVCGNTMPTSFSDISDKYRYELDTETDQLETIKIWSKDRAYLELTVGEELTENPDVEFILVTGKSSRKETAEYVEACWKKYPNALAIRPAVEYLEETVTKAQATEPVNLLSAIEKDLEGTEMLKVFKELQHAID